MFDSRFPSLTFQALSISHRAGKEEIRREEGRKEIKEIKKEEGKRKKVNLAVRTKNFALQIISLFPKLPRTTRSAGLGENN